MPGTEDLTFEAAYEELTRIIDELEAGELPLDESMARFERGRTLIKLCGDLLGAAELRINQLSNDGESVEPLHPS
ncbi:MAG TPA: exodeoxyribonuclease VII small subunit [Aggregatilineales bacterium]|nr:exodeoxyribonuclease VII small subunit [Aggregatilineales bacterium]